MTRLIEIDVDGVLLDIIGHLETASKKEGVDFDSSLLTDYRFGRYSEEVRSWVFSKFKSHEFIDSIPLKGGYFPMLLAFTRLQLSGAEVVFNTRVSNESVVSGRKAFLDNFANEISHLVPVSVVVEYGDSGGKRMLDSYVCIEDCTENLTKSSARYKIVIDALYNQDFETDNDRRFRVECLADALHLATDLLLRENLGLCKEAVVNDQRRCV